MEKLFRKSILAVSLVFAAQSANAEIKIGAIYDITGDLNIFGLQKIHSMQLAVDDINANGGLLGEQVSIATYDTQSSLNKYTQFARTAVLKGGLSAVFAGVTSSSREAVRPIFRQANMPYFYTSTYEGGACDRQTFVTGPSASQQLKPLIEWAIKEYGPKIFVMAPDYNFGTIATKWVHEYAKQFGGEVVGEDILPLTMTDYSPTIQKIQKQKPDFLVALPVGPSQVGFLEQFSSAGLKSSVPVVSSNYSTGNEQVLLSPKAGEGITVAHVYFQSLDLPENKQFLTTWHDKYGEGEHISPEAVTVWNAVHLWAEAVKKAGTADHDKVIDMLEKGNISFNGPNGPVTMSGGSHHVTQNIYIGRGNTDYGFALTNTYPNVEPSYENEVCDLITDPKIAKQFTP